MNEYSKYLMETTAEFPHFRVVRKSDSSFMKFLNVFVGLFNKTFMDGYITTIGNYMWVPDGWDEWSDKLKASVLRHERVHLRQQERYGMLWYALMYTLLPLPAFKTYRAALEMEAYEESIAAYYEYSGEFLALEELMPIFTGPDYFWMLPDSEAVTEWYLRACEKAIQRYGK